MQAGSQGASGRAGVHRPRRGPSEGRCNLAASSAAGADTGVRTRISGGTAHHDPHSVQPSAATIRAVERPGNGGPTRQNLNPSGASNVADNMESIAGGAIPPFGLGCIAGPARIVCIGPGFPPSRCFLGGRAVYYLLILAVVFERLAELVVAQRNARWSFAQGGKEFGRPHYVVMVILHTALLLGCVVEPWALHRPFIPWLGWPMLAVVVASQGLRWWCVKSLGKRWNTRVIVLPHATLVRRGPYRWMRHPNYVAVVAEGFALPLVHTAWLTTLVFTLANATLLTVRLRVENSVLGYI